MTSIWAFFLLICVLVAVHEYGHFWAARRCGVRVLRFSIGFGKVLYKRIDKSGTEWVFSLIPLGGYVKMLNDEPEGKENERYQNKSVWQRMLIILAGPLANFLFAIIAYWALFIVGVPTLKPVVGNVISDTIAANAKIPNEFEIRRIAGSDVYDWEETTLVLMGKAGSPNVKIEGNIIDESKLQSFTLDLSNWKVDNQDTNPLTTLGIEPKKAVIEPVIENIKENSPAAQAGLQVGDKILRVNQQPFNWVELVNQIETGKQIGFEIERAGEINHIFVNPQKDEKLNRYVIGITPTYHPLAEKYRSEIKYDILSALYKSVEKVNTLIHTIIEFIGNLFTGDLSLKTMGGPISMAKGAALMVDIGWSYYLGFMALISVNLGVMNLFPILPLDGGQFILLSFEAIRKKAVSMTVQLWFQKIGMLFVLGLMAFALLNDLIHF